MILAFTFFHLFFVIFISNLAETAINTELEVKNYSVSMPNYQLESDSLTLNKLILVSNIENKEPGDSLVYDQIAVGQKVWAYAEFYNLSHEQNVLFNWFKDDELYLSFPVKVGVSTQWRTYSYITARKGSWKLQLVVEDGEKPMKELSFTVLD